MANLSEYIDAMLRGDAPPPPIAQLIGFNVLEAAAGRSTIEFEADERHANPMGTLHGGVLCDVAYAAMGMAFASTLNGPRFSRRHLPQRQWLKTVSDFRSFGGRLQTLVRLHACLNPLVNTVGYFLPRGFKHETMANARKDVCWGLICFSSFNYCYFWYRMV